MANDLPDQVLLDVWGVLHDGQLPYVDAPRFLARLARWGIDLALVSNATWSGAMLRDDLADRGFDVASIAAFWTAGDAAQHLLRERNPARVAFEGEPVARWLIAGFDEVELPQAELLVYAQETPETAQRLERARVCGIPVLCVNPDAWIEDRFGSREPKAGAFTQGFVEAGGELWLGGKPDRRIFDLAITGERPIMVGDNPATDLLGAQRAGLPSVWLARRPWADEAELVERHQPTRVVRSLDALWPG